MNLARDVNWPFKTHAPGLSFGHYAHDSRRVILFLSPSNLKAFCAATSH